MKWFITLLFPLSVFANEMQTAYDKEIQFLEKQKNSLVQLKERVKKDAMERRAQGEAEIKRLNLELSQLSIKNLTEQETVQRWEKLLKDAASGGPQLEKNLRRMEDQFRQLREKTPLPNFQISKGATIDQFQSRLEEGLMILKVLGEPSLRSHAFLDTDGKLVKGDVLALGLFGAYGVQGGNTFMLAPYDSQWLKAVEKLAGNELLLFDPSFQQSPLKTHAGWKERAADMAPGLVMVLIMLTVVALFVALARA